MSGGPIVSFEEAASPEATVLDAIGEAILVLDPDGAVCYQSGSVADVFGYEDDELVGTSALDLVHPDNRDSIEELLERLDPGATEAAEWRILAADGAWRWAEVSITDPVSGPIEGYVVSARDVTERVHARWDREALLDRMTEAFFAVDTDWRVTHVNDHAAELLGIDEATALGQDLAALFPEGVGSTFADRYGEAMQTGEPTTFEAYYEPLDVWFSVSAYPGETGLSVFFEDVTERKRSEIALAKNEKALRDLHDVAADKGLAFEEKLLRLLDLGRDRLDLELGFLTRIEAAGDAATEDGLQRVVACQGDHDLLVRGESCPLSDAYCQRTIETDGLMATRNPQNEWVAESAYRTFGLETYLGGKVIVDGEIYGTLCFADTEHREHPFRSDEEAFVELLVEWMAYELERERRETRLEQQNDRLEAFASMVSHDLRNPLTIAQGNLDLAEESGDPEQFQTVRESLDRMERLIDDMLWLAREGRDVAATEPVGLVDVAREAWGFVSTTAGDLTVECDDAVTVQADRPRLLQCFENLFRNAIDHSETGDVAVRVGLLTDESVGRAGDAADSTSRNDGIVEGHVGFYVEDDGPGIPPDDRDSVFQTGFTTDEEGTGFGLAIVQRIADAHGWAVTVGESASGGARFEFHRS